VKTQAEAHATLDQWFDAGCVGNLIFYRAPRASHVDAIVEQVVKAHEMDQVTHDAFVTFMELGGVQRGEVYRDKDGKPDRVKLVRSI
jgi:hypothetical protein